MEAPAVAAPAVKDTAAAATAGEEMGARVAAQRHLAPEACYLPAIRVQNVATVVEEVEVEVEVVEEVVVEVEGEVEDHTF